MLCQVGSERIYYFASDVICLALINDEDFTLEGDISAARFFFNLRLGLWKVLAVM